MANKPPAGPSGCIFCDKPAQDLDAENLIVHRGERAFVIMNLYPYNNGHLMVVPYAHTCTLTDLDEATMLEVMQLIVRSQATLDRALKPHGYNIGMNLGRVAGAGIADHLHMHIVPRWNGDANFMPVLSDTRVLPDSLENSYRLVVDAWRNDD